MSASAEQVYVYQSPHPSPILHPTPPYLETEAEAKLQNPKISVPRNFRAKQGFPLVILKNKLEVLSVENKLPTFNNLMSKETPHMYIFVQVTLTLNR